VNPRMRRLLQKVLAMALYAIGILAVVLAFVPIQFPNWWPNIQLPTLVVLPAVQITWWPLVIGISPASHYLARLFLTLAFGLTIFLPQVEVTFVSMLRRRSPIGSKYVDRKDFTCPSCGTVNRPGVQFCVKCGSAVSSGTKLWGAQVGQVGGGLTGLIKLLLLIAAIMAFFLGLFDLSIYSALTQVLGTESGSVLFATLVSTIPALAGYVALKESAFRRFGSFRKFDRIVYGNVVWIVFGLLFLLLFAYAFFGPPLDLIGSVLLMWIQLALGITLLIHPILRRKVSKSVPLPYP